MFERISPDPSGWRTMMLAAVSSQLVSIPKIFIGPEIFIGLLLMILKYHSGRREQGFFRLSP